ncbi:MAG TPA: hypothetical protein VFH95_06270 [Candidatus Kapabacteria bacterium]|nr:hypothetical protein [Candidatus Kapabacteria bacterium]
MQLNSEGRERFKAHLQTFLRQPCSVCGTGSWQAEDAIFELREFMGDARQQQISVKPVLAMTCNGCGHIVFMSPLKTGIIGTPQATEQTATGQAAPSETVTETFEEVTEE